jgi:hypothetical protein
MAALRGTDQNIATVMAASAALLNSSAQNIAYPGLAAPSASGCAVVVAGWKQDDWTSVATLAGMSEIGEGASTVGDDAGIVWDYLIQAAASTVGSGSFAVTGGAVAISRALALVLRPYPAPTAASFTLPASTLTQDTAWQWRVRTWDAAGASGTWSPYSTFSTGQGGTVTVTDPAVDNPANVITSSYLVKWSLVGATQADYRVEVYRTDTSAPVYSSGWVTSATTEHTVTGLLSDVEQRIEVTTRTAGLVTSNTGTRLITPSYAAPDTPLLSVLEMPADGHTLLQVTNPAPTGSRPTASYTKLLRRATTGFDAGQDWVTIGAVGEDGSWRDYTAAAQVTYDYKAQAVAPDGTTTDSTIDQGALALEGVWIHDPADPANADDSAHQFPFGRTSNSDDLDLFGEGTYYAGRELPVWEFGEHRAEKLNVVVDVAGGATWLNDVAALRTFAVQRTVVCVRDARGRRVFGVLERPSTSDERWGSSIGFAATSVDYDETYTGIP